MVQQDNIFLGSNTALKAECNAFDQYIEDRKSYDFVLPFRNDGSIDSLNFIDTLHDQYVRELHALDGELPNEKMCSQFLNLDIPFNAEDKARFPNLLAGGATNFQDLLDPPLVAYLGYIRWHLAEGTITPMIAMNSLAELCDALGQDELPDREKAIAAAEDYVLRRTIRGEDIRNFASAVYQICLDFYITRDEEDGGGIAEKKPPPSEAQLGKELLSALRASIDQLDPETTNPYFRQWTERMITGIKRHIYEPKELAGFLLNAGKEYEGVVPYGIPSIANYTVEPKADLYFYDDLETALSGINQGPTRNY
jgi:hypothetical protein